MGVNQVETRTRSPVAKKAGLDVLVGKILPDENVVVKEDHGYTTRNEHGRLRISGKHTCSDVVRCASEHLDCVEFILR